MSGEEYVKPSLFLGIITNLEWRLSQTARKLYTYLNRFQHFSVSFLVDSCNPIVGELVSVIFETQKVTIAAL